MKEFWKRYQWFRRTVWMTAVMVPVFIIAITIWTLYG